MSSIAEPAPLARMSKIAPSLDSIASKPVKDHVIPLETYPKNKVETKQSTSTSTDDDDEEPNIPDGGWGWVVVIATFFLCMIADGVTFSFGMLYEEFHVEFEASNSATSLVGSLFMAVPLLTGPIMSALVDKFGCRTMTMVGGVISASGFALSSKCYSLSVMYLTFGVLAGLGLGLIYVTVVVGVAFWFDKKRTLAVGISSAGIGIGTFVFSPLTTFLLGEFRWRSTTLILAGFFLNMCVCGALMRDPDWLIEEEKKNSKKSKNNKSEKSSKVSLADSVNVEELRALLTSDQDVKVLLKDLESNLGDDEDTKKLTTYFQSTLNLPTFVRQHEKVPVEVLELLAKNKNVSNVILAHYPSLLLSKAKSDANVANGKELARSPSIHQDTWSKVQHDAATKDPLLRRKNSTHEKYFKNLKMDKHSLVRAVTFNTNKYRFKASSCPNIYRLSMAPVPQEREEKWYSEILALLKDMCDFKLFTELHFVLLSLSTITFFTWFIVPYFYINTLMTKVHGYTEEQASYVISNVGISNTIGMLVLGWAGDRPWMNITKAYAIFLVLCGVTIAGQMWFVTNPFMLHVCASLFGIGMSSHFAFTPGIVMELVPMDRFTIAYGLQLMCQGIGTLVGPPYAGWLYDITKKWEQTFYQAAIWIILSGVFIWFIPYLKNRKLIGKGDVEKKIEGARDRVIPLGLLLLFTILCFIFVFYLTGTAISTYNKLKATETS